MIFSRFTFVVAALAFISPPSHAHALDAINMDGFAHLQQYCYPHDSKTNDIGNVPMKYSPAVSPNNCSNISRLINGRQNHSIILAQNDCRQSCYSNYQLCQTAGCGMERSCVARCEKEYQYCLQSC